MNLRLPSVTVSTHTSASNAVVFQSPAMPNARMSLWTQSVYSFPSHLVLSVLCTLKVSENDSLRQPPAAHSEEHPRPQKSSRLQRRLNALTPDYLKGAVVRSHPMVWSLALCPDDTKQDSVVYGAEFGVVFLAKGPRTASIQEGLDCLRLNHSGLEGERDFLLVVEFPYRCCLNNIIYSICSWEVSKVRRVWERKYGVCGLIVFAPRQKGLFRFFLIFQHRVGQSS